MWNTISPINHSSNALLIKLIVKCAAQLNLGDWQFKWYMWPHYEVLKELGWLLIGGFRVRESGGSEQPLFSFHPFPTTPPRLFGLWALFLSLSETMMIFLARSHFNTQLKKLKIYLKFFLAHFDSGLRNNYMFSKSKFGLSPFTSYQKVLDPPLNLSVPSQNKS